MGYNNTLEVSSDSSDDDFDIFNDLGITKSSKKSTPEKRPNDILLSDDFHPKEINPFKMPKLAKIPSFLRARDMNVLLKTKELVKLHEEDSSKASAAIEEEEHIKQRVKQRLSKEAQKDEAYVKLVLMKHKEMKLDDLYIIGVPLFVEPSLEIDTCLEGSAIPRDQQSLFKSDFFNTINYEQLKRIKFEFEESFINFADYIGFDLSYLQIDETTKILKKITKNDLQFDPCKRLQDVKLIVLRVSKYVQLKTSLAFELDVWKQLVRMVGLLMIDKNIYFIAENQSLSSIMNEILTWRFNKDSSIAIRDTVEIWNDLTDINSFKYRILEKLDPSTSPVTAQLRLQFGLLLISENTVPNIQYYYSDYDLFTFINGVILEQLNKIYDDPELLNAIKLDSPEARTYFQTLTLKFRCIIMIIRKEHTNTTIGEAKDVTLIKISKRLHKLQSRITVSYEKLEQTVVKSLIMMLISMLDEDLGTLAGTGLQ